MPRAKRRRGAAKTVVSVAVLCSAGCATIFGTSSPERGSVPCCTTEGVALELQYLGTGGWFIRYGEAQLLTAPLFSNPQGVPSLFKAIGPDTAAIEGALARLPSLLESQAILVGHAHYDHLLDVPYVMTETAPNAHVYGSKTMANILAAAPGIDAGRIHSVEDATGSVDQTGDWVTVPGGGIRFMPLTSDHAPHFEGIELYQGEVTEPLDELPRTARDWLGGATLAYLIDFLGPDGEIEFRIHYVDSAASWPGAAPPLPLPDGHPVDVQILCAPSYDEVEAYPEGLVGGAAPRFVLVGHWEDFFSEWTQVPDRSVRGSNLDGFTGRLSRVLPAGAAWTLPNPGDVVRIPHP